MKKAERAEFIHKKLEHLYPETPIPLDHKDAYTLLIAVLLSAQCTDERVNKITPALFERLTHPKNDPAQQRRDSRDHQALRPESKEIKSDFGSLSYLVGKAWRQSASNLRRAGRASGVGHKTASVVMSQAFGFPAFAVDTHIHRLAQRWKLTNGKNVVQTEKDLKSLFPENSWNKLHLQIIYYGRALQGALLFWFGVRHLHLAVSQSKKASGNIESLTE